MPHNTVADCDTSAKLSDIALMYGRQGFRGSCDTRDAKKATPYVKNIAFFNGTKKLLSFCSFLSFN